jgi:hypothetical protein
MHNGSTMMVPHLRPAIPSNLVCEIHQQHNVVVQIHEKHHEFYASGMEVHEAIGNGSNSLSNFKWPYKLR